MGLVRVDKSQPTPAPATNLGYPNPCTSLFMTEGGFPIATKLRAETIELDEVADDVMSFLHMKVVKLVLGVTDRIVGTELA